MSTILRRAGWIPAQSPKEAALIVVNSCAFIAPAVEESVETLLEAMEWKRADPEHRLLVLAGCLPGRFGHDRSPGIDEVDLVIGPGQQHLLGRLAGRGDPAEDIDLLQSPETDSPSSSRYLKISDGCSNNCTYCTIPLIRGPHRSIPSGLIMARAAALVDQGVSEVGLVGQDTTAWREGDRDVWDLLEELSATYPAIWWRLYYVHPSRFDRRLLDVFDSRPNVCRYLDLPLQHTSGRILEAMGRSYDSARMVDIMSSVQSLPFDVAVRVTLMVGFPGETEEEFGEMLDLLGGFDCIRHVIAFPYYDEEGTAIHAADCERLPESVVLRRLDALSGLSEALYASWAERMEGATVRVLADTRTRGHTMFDAPHVDGIIEFTEEAEAGRMICCRLMAGSGPDFMGKPLPRESNGCD